MSPRVAKSLPHSVNADSLFRRTLNLVSKQLRISIIAAVVLEVARTRLMSHPLAEDVRYLMRGTLNVTFATRQVAPIIHCSMIQRCSEELALAIPLGAQHLAVVEAGVVAGAEAGEIEDLVGGQLIITLLPRGSLTTRAEAGSMTVMTLITRMLVTVMTHKTSSRCRRPRPRLCASTPPAPATGSVSQ